MIEVITQIIDFLKWIIAGGHKKLHDYCVIEVIVISVSLYLLVIQTHLYFENLERLQEWDVAFFIPFNAALFGLIKECRLSLLERYKSCS